jgi:hypothetical protein
VSADNWAKCPRCTDSKQAEIDRLTEEMNESYSKVSVEKFMGLNKQLLAAKDAAFRAQNASETFREDYEIYGAEDGEIKIRYSGYCTECKLQVKIDVDHPFYPEPPKLMSTDFPGTSFGPGDTITVLPDDGSDWR